MMLDAWQHDVGSLHLNDEENSLINEHLGLRMTSDHEGSSGEGAEGEGESEEEEDFISSFGGAITDAVSSTIAFVKRKTISEATERMLEDVLRLANDFMEDRSHNSMQILAACRLLATFRSNGPEMSGVAISDQGILRHAYYWWQFAEAAFGWALLHGIKYSEGFSGFALGVTTPNEVILQRYCKLDAKDVKYYRWDSRPGHPGNFIVVDHRTKSIVWSVRGTFALSDVLTDLVAGSATFLKQQGWFAHKGMAFATNNLVGEAWDTVQQLLDEYPNYGLVTTGHSMGAAVATLIAIWVRHKHPEINVVCWAFACPPCISMPLAEYCRDFVFGITYGDDVVCRASVHSINALKVRLRHVLQEGPGFWASVTSKPDLLSAELEERFVKQGIISKDYRWVCEENTPPDPARLWPPARQMYIIHRGTDIVVEEAHCRQFNSIVVTNTMFTHHTPMEYDKIFVKLLRKIEEQKLQLQEEVVAVIDESAIVQAQDGAQVGPAVATVIQEIEQQHMVDDIDVLPPALLTEEAIVM